MKEKVNEVEVSVEIPVAEAATEEAMISNLRAFRRVKARLEEQRERGRMLLAQIEAEIAQDLAPLEREMEALRVSMQTYIAGHNGGEKFKVPGLGTAYIQSRRRVRIVDMEAFLNAVHAYTGGRVDHLYDEPKPNAAACKKYAENWVSDEGEILPGVESEETETLSVRLSSKEAI